jgi:hypothetical protein
MARPLANRIDRGFGPILPKAAPSGEPSSGTDSTSGRTYAETVLPGHWEPVRMESEMVAPRRPHMCPPWCPRSAGAPGSMSWAWSSNH